MLSIVAIISYDKIANVEMNSNAVVTKSQNAFSTTISSSSEIIALIKSIAKSHISIPLMTKTSKSSIVVIFNYE